MAGTLRSAYKSSVKTNKVLCGNEFSVLDANAKRIRLRQVPSKSNNEQLQNLLVARWILCSSVRDMSFLFEAD